MCGGGVSDWIKDHKKELEVGAGVVGTALTAGMAAPALAAATGAAPAVAGMGGGTASLFGANAAGDGLAASLLANGATPSLASLAGADTAAGAGMGGGTAALFGAGQLPADQVGPSMFGEFKAGMGDITRRLQPFVKGIGTAQKVMGTQPQPMPAPAGRPPSMTQQQPQVSSAQILAGQGPSAQIAGALPPGAQSQLTPAQLALLLKLRGYA